MPPLFDAEIETAHQRGQAAAASDPRAVPAWVEGDRRLLPGSRPRLQKHALAGILF